MRGPAKGIWYHAYVVLDIFSRYVVGWRVERIEDGQLAADLVQEIVEDTGGHPPGYLHADGGAAMTSKALASLLVDMDITRSHSRPRTSNDNPFSEAQFRTMKYTPDYPERFASVNGARAWMEGFTAYYNHEHRHSGIGYHTPPACITALPRLCVNNVKSLWTKPMARIPNGLPAVLPHPRCR